MSAAAPATRDVQTVDDFINHVSGHNKQAETRTEPGSIGGATQHPIKSVDDGTHEQPHGKLYAEKSEDLKKDQKGTSVENKPELKSAGTIASQFAKGADAEADQMNIGLHSAPTGEDPKNETGRAQLQNNESQSPSPDPPTKGSATQIKSGSAFEKLANRLAELGNSLTSKLVVLGFDQKKEANAGCTSGDAGMHTATPTSHPKHETKPPVVTAVTKTAATSPIDDAWLAGQVGYEMAGLVTGNLNKEAADTLVRTTICNVIKLAEDRADRVIRFYDHHFNELNKQAQTQTQPKRADDALPPSSPGLPMDPGAAGGPPPGMGGPPPGAGGPPPGMGGPPGAGGGEDAEMQQLLQILQQLPPEELEKLLAEAEGGGAGGPPGAGGMPPGADGGGPPHAEGPGGGGPPPGGEPPAGIPPKTAAVKPTGTEKSAADAAKLAADKSAMKGYLTDLVNRSRRK